MAQTNVKRVNLGGGLRLTVGSFTATQIAGTDSIVVEGPEPYVVLMQSQDTSGALMMHTPRFSSSVSGGLTTVTIYLQEGVTTGKFAILH